MSKEMAGKPSRRYQFEGQFECQHNGEKKKSKQIFCFNDLMIFAKPSSKNSYKYLDEVNIDHNTMVVTNPDELVISVNTTDGNVVIYFQDQPTYVIENDFLLISRKNGLLESTILLKR